jgi:hypothetical protein
MSNRLDDIPKDLLVAMGHITPYQLEEKSKYQNSMEFIAVVTVIALLVSMGYRDISIVLEGDNTTALDWANTQNFAGMFSTASSLAYITLCQSSGIVVESIKHIAGTLMDHRSDKLSRGKDPASFGYPEAKIRRLANNPALMELVALMDPTRPHDIAHELDELWRKVRDITAVLMQEGGGWVTVGQNI